MKNGKARPAASRTPRGGPGARCAWEGFGDYAGLRNGAEAVLSSRRRDYRLAKLPRGRAGGELFSGAKVVVLNFRKLVGFVKGTRRRVANPLLAAS